MNVRRIRRSLLLTQSQFADLLGVHAMTVSKWERGVIRPMPYQRLLLVALQRAVRRRSDVGEQIREALDNIGPIYALSRALAASFESGTK